MNYVFHLFLMISGSKIIKKGNGYILRKCFSKTVSRAIGWVEFSDPDLPSQLFSNPLLKIRLSSHGLHCFSSSVMDDPSNMSPKQWPINSEHALSRSTNHSADMDELKPGEINRLNIGSCVGFIFFSHDFSVRTYLPLDTLSMGFSHVDSQVILYLCYNNCITLKTRLVCDK